MKKTSIEVALVALWFSINTLGCPATMTPVGVNRGHYRMQIPSNARQDCVSQCQEVGMPLGSMVLMGGNVGCVCETQESNAQATMSRKGAAAGAIAVMLEQQREEEEKEEEKKEEEAKEKKEHRRRQRQQTHSHSP